MSLIEDNAASPECEVRALCNYYLTFKLALCDALPTYKCLQNSPKVFPPYGVLGVSD